MLNILNGIRENDAMKKEEVLALLLNGVCQATCRLVSGCCLGL